MLNVDGLLNISSGGARSRDIRLGWAISHNSNDNIQVRARVSCKRMRSVQKSKKPPARNHNREHNHLKALNH